MSSSVLRTITGPGDLRHLDVEQLVTLAAEIRAELISTVTRAGGHLGPNLGVVELTIALHRVVDSPDDAIVWDTGHQAYVHKLLTGRQAAFDGLRRRGGLSGYPNRRESKHDLVENSHASTALSYADGLAKAAQLQGSDRTVVAVVGDGALTGGMAWEALNNIAAASRRIVIVLNDNGRSYSPTVGALASRLAEARASGCPAAMFEHLGLRYIGPVDGHDLAALEKALTVARAADGPVVVHCLTRKGCGFLPAEQDEADRLHTVSPGGPAPAAGARRPGWTEVFAGELVEIASHRPDVVAVTAAMERPTGLHPLARAFPDRVYDVGIAEQHAVTSAAGLAMGGLHPVVCIYATFLNRAFDQVLLDVALHGLPVTFVLDRAGVTGSDGPSHHGMWDLSMLGTVPGMRVAAPRDEATLRASLAEAVEISSGPTVLRFPKGSVAPPLPALGRHGDLDVLHDHDRDEVLIVGVGPLAGAAVTAARALTQTGIGVRVVDPRWVLPVSGDLVGLAAQHDLVVTVEDNGLAGGFGDAMARALREARVHTDLLTLGLRQAFLEHGERDELLAGAGLDAAGIAASIRGALERRPLRVYA